MWLSWTFKVFYIKEKRETAQNRNKGSIVANIVMFILHIGPVKLGPSWDFFFPYSIFSL